MRPDPRRAEPAGQRSAFERRLRRVPGEDPSAHDGVALGQRHECIVTGRLGNGGEQLHGIQPCAFAEARGSTRGSGLRRQTAVDEHRQRAVQHRCCIAGRAVVRAVSALGVEPFERRPRLQRWPLLGGDPTASSIAALRPGERAYLLTTTAQSASTRSRVASDIPPASAPANVAWMRRARANGAALSAARCSSSIWMLLLSGSSRSRNGETSETRGRLRAVGCLLLRFSSFMGNILPVDHGVGLVPTAPAPLRSAGTLPADIYLLRAFRSGCSAG
jgi:hypothetical protein